ncbi:hypothetical protein V1506DRAFT_537684 [Lipomyces tetrasporus]
MPAWVLRISLALIALSFNCVSRLRPPTTLNELANAKPICNTMVCYRIVLNSSLGNICGSIVHKLARSILMP